MAVEDPNHVRLFLGLHAAWRRTNNNLCVRNQSGQQIQLNIQKLVHTCYAQSDVTECIKAGHASWFAHLEV